MEISVLNKVLNFVLARGWTDYDNFSSKLASTIVKQKPRNRVELVKILESTENTFFKLNGLNRKKFIENFPTDQILNIISKKGTPESLTFKDIFEEVDRISVTVGKSLLLKLREIDERVIQDAIQDSLRELNATNTVERSHDSVLEVADREHFSLLVNGVSKSFALVVKGYKSINMKTITAKGIMHQITRAYNRTYPDYLLLVLAKNPSDSLVSELVQYGKSVGNEHLVILCDPVDLTRFLKSRNII